jgi:hypothetical protein
MFHSKYFLRGWKEWFALQLANCVSFKIVSWKMRERWMRQKNWFLQNSCAWMRTFFFSFQISYFNMPYPKLRGNKIGRPEDAWETQSAKKKTLKNMVLNWTLLTPLMITKEQLQWWTKTLLFWEFGYLDVKGTFCVLPNCCSNEINLLCNHLHAFLIQNLIIYLKKLKNLIS